MKPKTKAQIQKEIEKMEAMRPEILPRGMFGDNLAKFDAALKCLKENMTVDQIYNEWDTTEEDYGEANQEIASAAEHARRWMDGEEKEAPSEGWPLTKDFKGF